jgi:hypothetical protein
MRSPTRKMLRTFYRPWYRRPFSWLLAIVPLVVVGRFAAGPWLEHRARVLLTRVPEHRVTFTGFEVFTFPPAIALRGVKVDRLVPAGLTPLLTADRVEIHLPWSELFARDRKVDLRLVRPTLLAGAGRALELGTLFGALPPVRVERLFIIGGAVRVQRGAEAAVWLEGIDALATDLATRRLLADPQAVVPVRFEGVLARSGRLRGRFDLRPWQASPHLRAELHLQGLALRDLERIAAFDSVGLASTGFVDLAAEVTVEAGTLEGQVHSAGNGLWMGGDPARLLVEASGPWQSVAPGVFLRGAPPANGDGADGASDGAAVEGAVTPPNVSAVEAVLGVVRGVLTQGLGRELQRLGDGQAVAAETPAAAPAP